MKRKLLALLMVFVMAMGLLAGCGEKTQPTDATKATDAPKTTDAPKATDAPETEPAPVVDNSEFVELVFYTYGDRPQGNWIDTVAEEWNKILKEKLNCSLSFEFIGSADWQSNYNLRVTSGDGIDIILSGDWMGLWDLAGRDAFYDISEILPTHAPLLYERVGEETWNNIKFNGGIYVIPETEYGVPSAYGFGYRMDWAKEAGLSDGIQDWDDITTYLTYVAANKEDVQAIDMNPDVAAFSDMYFRSMYDYGYNFVAGKVGDVYPFFVKDLETYELVSPYFDDVYVEYAKMMKEWADAGVFSVDFLNTSGRSADAIFRKGESAAFYEHMESYAYYEEYYFYRQNKQEGAEVAYWSSGYLQDEILGKVPTSGALCISSFSEHPERALQVIELLYSDQEFYRLLHYGMEGINYTVSEDGRKVNQNFEQYPGEQYGFQTNIWGGRTNRYELPLESWDKNATELVASLTDKMIPYPYAGFTWDSSEVSAEVAAIKDVCAQYATAINWGMVDDVEKEIETFRNALLAAGFEDVQANIQSQLDAWNAAR